MAVMAQSPRDPVRKLGGPASCAAKMMLAKMDVKNGKIAVESQDDAQRMVDSTKDELLNAGVVAALILSIMYGSAYAESAAMYELNEIVGPWTLRDYSVLTSMCANFVSVCAAFITVYVSSTMYTQISFWMPSLEAQLWYVGNSQTAASSVALSKNMTIYASLITLALEVAVTGTYLDVVGFAPIIALFFASLVTNCTLKPNCKNYLVYKLHVLTDELMNA